MQEPALSTLAIRVRDLTKGFGDVVAISGISFDAPKGSFVTILGPSGCGKTTILRCIAGVEEPDNGTIEIDGRMVFSSDSKLSIPSENRSIGMVFQSYALWPHMNVFENVAYPLKVRRTPKNEIKQRVVEVLGLLEISSLQDRTPSALSGGQQQRVALARALVYNPEILLLDEPLSNLDDQLRQSVRDDLKEIQRRIGVTTIYVTHDRVEALSLSDKIILLSKGKLMAEGKPRELIEKPPNSYVASFLGGMLVLDGKISSVNGKSTTVQTKFGPIDCSLGDLSLNISDSIKLCIKSSMLSIVEEVLGEKNIIPGVIRGLTIDTDRVWYRISFDEQTIMVLKTSNGSQGVGDPVYLRVPESAVYLVHS